MNFIDWLREYYLYDFKDEQIEEFKKHKEVPREFGIKRRRIVATAIIFMILLYLIDLIFLTG